MTARESKILLAHYQEQTCGNFADLNSDFDEVKKSLREIKTVLGELLQGGDTKRMVNNRDIYEKDANGRYVHDANERQSMIAERIENGTYYDYDPNQEQNNDNE